MAGNETASGQGWIHCHYSIFIRRWIEQHVPRYPGADPQYRQFHWCTVAGGDRDLSRNVVLLSATEGDDKPVKYPVMFRTANLLLLTKSDLLPVLDDFSPTKAERNLRRQANPAP